jgi:O-antigen/teichoic acid export membrane protein
MIGLWTIVASVLGLAAVAAAAWTEAPLAGFMLAACVLPLGPHAGVWLQLRSTQGWMRAGGAAAPEMRGLGKESALFFMPQLGSVFIGSFVPPLIAFFAGPAAVASYSVLQRLFGLALQVQGLVLMPTWPAYTNAAATGDAAFAGRTYRMTWLVTVAGFALPTLLLTPFVPAFVHLWLGDHAPARPVSLLWALSGWHVLQYLGQPQAILLNGMGRLQRLVLSVWLCLSLSLWLSPRWGPTWGAEGVIFALAVPYALLNLPVITREAARALALMREGGAVRPPQPTT